MSSGDTGALGGGAQALGTYAGAQQTQKLIDALTATAGAADQKQIEIDGVGTQESTKGISDFVKDLMIKSSAIGGRFGSPTAGTYADEFVTPFVGKNGGMMTGGKFNHKTNPIDIVQKGKKVGEMTGGEVILNPTQQKKLSQESAYFRSLLKKFNKQK